MSPADIIRYFIISVDNVTEKLWYNMINETGQSFWTWYIYNSLINFKPLSLGEILGKSQNKNSPAFIDAINTVLLSYCLDLSDHGWLTEINIPYNQLWSSKVKSICSAQCNRGITELS